MKVGRLGENGWLRYDRGRSIQGKEGALGKGSRHRYQKDLSTKGKKKKNKREKEE